MEIPERPAEAWWSEEDGEWVYGDKDADGRLIGRVLYWDKNGVFISDAEHVAGKPHGRARRFLPDGSVWQDCRYVDGRIDGVRSIFRPKKKQYEDARFQDLTLTIVVYECVYREGDLIGTRFRDVDGVEVDTHGNPVPARPDGVEPTATPFQRGWLFMRRRGEDGHETLEMRQYYEDGSLKEERLEDGTEREFHESSALRSTGKRVRHEGKRPTHGPWQYGDEGGVVRRESSYEYGVETRRRWLRPESESGSGAVACSGPVSKLDRFDGVESGEWVFRDVEGAVVRRVDFGVAITNGALLGSPAFQEDVADGALREAASGRGASATMATVRLAARSGTAPQLHVPGSPWQRLNRSGEFDRWSRTLNELVHAFAFEDTVQVALSLSAELFRLDHPQVALDVVDGVLALRDDAALREARVRFLRALGAFDLAEQALDALDPSRMTQDEQALLFAVRAAPEDDAPRLAYASAIETVSPDHAALIRLDCAGGPGTRKKLSTRAAKALPKSLRKTPLVRGFVESDALYVEAGSYLSHYDPLFRLAPLAADLTLIYASDHIAELVTMPSLQRYTRLSFWDTLLFDGRAAQLARCPHLSQLEHLGLRDTNLYDDDLIPILESHAFPRLRSLDISSNREGQDYGFEAFRVLVDAMFAPHLESFAMDRRYFDEDVVGVFSQLPRLRDLSLEGSSLGSAVVELAALDRPWNSLDLTRSGISANGAEALAASTYMRALRSLRLASNPLGDEGVRAIALSEKLANVEHLDLGGTHERVGPVLGVVLRDAPMAGSLRTLLLSLASLGTDGAKALAMAPLTELERLNLHNNQIGDEGAVALAASKHLHAMRHLDLSGNGITDQGAFALIESKCFADLNWLELGGADLSEKATTALKKRFGEYVKLEYPWNRR